MEMTYREYTNNFFAKFTVHGSADEKGWSRQNAIYMQIIMYNTGESYIVCVRPVARIRWPKHPNM